MFLQAYYNTEDQVFTYPASLCFLSFPLFSQHHFKVIICTGS